MEMQQRWIGAYMAILLMITHVCAQDLQVGVAPTRSRFSSEQDVVITLKYKNTGLNTVFIYKWYLPHKKLDASLFKVTLKGKSVNYIGPLVKRKASSIADTVPLKSGEEVSTLVRLSSAYAITKSGDYTVEVQLNVASVLWTPARDLKSDSAPSDAVGQPDLRSTPVTFSVVGRPNTLTTKKLQTGGQVRAGRYTYIGCTASRRSLIAAGIRSGALYASGAVTYLKSLKPSTSKRYVTWFGVYSLTNLNTLEKHFTKISAVFRSKPMTFDCGCNEENVYSYVYKDDPYTIYLCPVFWRAPTSGTDSKGGTLVHETSHFTVVADTYDFAYGQTNAMSLASATPDSAVFNADNHEYFAENNPALA